MRLPTNDFRLISQRITQNPIRKKIKSKKQTPKSWRVCYKWVHYFLSCFMISFIVKNMHGRCCKYSFEQSVVKIQLQTKARAVDGSRRQKMYLFWDTNMYQGNNMIDKLLFNETVLDRCAVYSLCKSRPRVKVTISVSHSDLMTHTFNN